MRRGAGAAVEKEIWRKKFLVLSKGKRRMCPLEGEEEEDNALECGPFLYSLFRPLQMHYSNLWYSIRLQPLQR